MYKLRNTVYADCGKYLVGAHSRGLQLNGEVSDFNEIDLTIDDMRVDGQWLIYGGGIFRWPFPLRLDYKELKKQAIRMRYSNDDQIAIILNKDDCEEDALAFTKMQEWRAWASLVAHKVMEVINQQKEEDNEDNL